MIWLISYFMKVLQAARVPYLSKWVMVSCQEENGKTSGKRLSAGFFSFLIAYMVHAIMAAEEPSSTKCDFVIWVIIALLGYIAAVFGMKYIPSFKSGGSPPKEEKKEEAK